jgi:thiol:disulfide interchange protein DsbD
MIPMTVSFLQNKAKLKAKGIRNYYLWHCNYFLLCGVGILVTWIFCADALNALSTNVWFNIIFFILLVVFASSFWVLSNYNSWANKVDNQADRGGIIGIFIAVNDACRTD